MVYLPDGRWLITVEAVSMATSSLAGKGQRAFHPISFKMALAEEELDLLEHNLALKHQKFHKLQTFLLCCRHQAINELLGWDRTGCGVRFCLCCSFSRTFLTTAAIVTLWPEVLVDSHPRRLGVTPRGIWDQTHANVLGERPANPGLIFHLDRFTLAAWENLDLGIGCHPINLIHPQQHVSAHMLGWIKTTWWGRHSTQVHNQGQVSAPSMCCKLWCAHFSREETERVMMQLWNVKHARNRRAARAPRLRESLHTCAGCTQSRVAPARKHACRSAQLCTSTGEAKKKRRSSQGVQDIVRADTDNNTNLLNVTQPTHS